MNREVQMLRVFPAAKENRYNPREERQENEQHLWHRLGEAASESAGVQYRPAQEGAHQWRRSRDVAESRLALFRRCRFATLEATTGKIANSPCSGRSGCRNRIAGGRFDLQAECLARFEAQVGGVGGDEEVNDARRDVETNGRDIARASPGQKLASEETRSSYESAYCGPQASVPPRELRHRVAGELAHARIRRNVALPAGGAELSLEWDAAVQAR